MPTTERRWHADDCYSLTVSPDGATVLLDPAGRYRLNLRRHVFLLVATADYSASAPVIDSSWWRNGSPWTTQLIVTERKHQQFRCGSSPARLLGGVLRRLAQDVPLLQLRHHLPDGRT